MKRSISNQNLAAFVERMWEMGVELSLNPEKQKITIWSGSHKYEDIAVTKESSVDELTSYLSDKENEPVEL